MEGPKIAIFERRYILKTIILGIYVRFRGGSFSHFFCWNRSVIQGWMDQLSMGWWAMSRTDCNAFESMPPEEKHTFRATFASMLHDRRGLQYVLNVLISHRFQHYHPFICLSCLHFWFWLCYSWCFQLPHPLKCIMIMQQQEPAWCINFDLIGHSRLCNCGLWNHKTFWMTWSTALSLIIHMLAPVISPIHRENGTISNLPEHHRMPMSTTPSQFQNPRPPQCICQLWKKSLIIRTCIAK